MGCYPVIAHIRTVGGEEGLREMPHIAVAGISGRVGDSLRRFRPGRAKMTGLVHNTAPVTEGLTRIVEGFDITDESKVKDIRHYPK
jgi:hypothetical protein